jgi:uncharacterized protein YbcV (DUF1398 family)
MTTNEAKILVLTLAEMVGVDPAKFAKKYVENILEAQNSGDTTFGKNKFANTWRDEGIKAGKKHNEVVSEDLDKLVELLEKLTK